MKPLPLWSSSFTPQRVAGGACRLAEPHAGAEAFHWLQSLPGEGGRNTVMRLEREGAPEALVPAPYSVRSRVNEYGGGAYTPSADGVWFVNDEDQALCRVRVGRVERIAGIDAMALGDLEWDACRGRVFAVAEDGSTGRQRIVAIDPDGTISTLREGADFYAAPRMAPDGMHLVWLEWSEPDMPWDSTRLMQARLESSGQLGEAQHIAGKAGESLCQPEWSESGELYVASDARNGFWNLCRVTGDGTVPVRTTAAECARPAFVFAQCLYAFSADGGVFLAEVREGLWRCLEGARDGSRMRERLAHLSEVTGVHAGPVGAIVVAGGASEPLGVHVRWRGEEAFRCVATSLDVELDPGFISRPEPMTFAVGAEQCTHALYFPPAHPERKLDGPPPLRLRCHGGPTSAASSALEPKTLFWTSRGFALLELNYRGSTGYGREFREALYGQWGVADVEDACAAARALATEGRCDSGRMIVAGSSAGGFTALNALCGDSPFAAGAISYGVADLTALVDTPLRFEAHYGEKLVGPWPVARSVYVARSPLNRADALARPTIFFQGEDDPVVPPEQSERMAHALATRGVAVAYEVFAGERHGFRRPETVARTLAAELAFHAKVLHLVAGEDMPEPRFLAR